MSKEQDPKQDNSRNFSDIYSYLTPKRFTNGVSDYRSLPDGSISLIYGVANMIKPGWFLDSVITIEDPENQRIAIVCMNDAFTGRLPEKPKSSNFIETKYLSKDERYLNEKTVDKLLAGTNYLGIAHARFNEIKNTRRTFPFGRKRTSQEYEPGVGIIDIALYSLEDRIKLREKNIARWEETLGEMDFKTYKAELDHDRSRFVPNPKRLF